MAICCYAAAMQHNPIQRDAPQLRSLLRFFFSSGSLFLFLAVCVCVECANVTNLAVLASLQAVCLQRG